MKTGWISPWYFAHIAPLIDAYYEGDLGKARIMYRSALATLEEEHDLDFRHAKWLRLHSAWLHTLLELGSEDETRSVLAELSAAWGAEQPGPESAEMARVVELLTRLQLDIGGWQPLSGADVRQLMADVPERIRGGNFWHEIGLWSFLHGDKELLERALLHFINDPPIQHQQWFRNRLMLMNRLLDDCATESDLEQVVEQLEARPQVRDMQRFILPACEQQGIVSPRAREALRVKARW